MDHNALAALRFRALPVARAGFQMTADPSTNTAMSMGLGGLVVGVGAFLYMQSCRSSMAQTFDEEAMDYDARASATSDLPDGKDHLNFLAGVAAGLEKASKKLRGSGS